MKFVPVLAALVLATPALAAGQDGHEGHGSHADHADHAEVAKEEAATAKFTTDTPIETLMADKKAKAILIKHSGGQDMSQHPMYDQFKAMSLKAVAPFSQGMITDEMLTKINADLAEIK